MCALKNFLGEVILFFLGVSLIRSSTVATLMAIGGLFFYALDRTPCAFLFFITYRSCALSNPFSPPPYTARSDRYTHDFVSDEEDGDDEAFQSPFENFTSTAPRFSVMLGQHQLSFDEESESGNSSIDSVSSVTPDKKKSPMIEEAKHEKRDSGIAGLEETSDIKILEEQKLTLLSPTGGDSSGGSGKETGRDGRDKSPSSSMQVLKGEEEDDDDVETEGEEPGGGGEDSGDTTEDEDGKVTLIDEVSDDEFSKAPPKPVLTKSSSNLAPSKPKSKPPPLSQSCEPVVVSRDQRSTSPPITPTRPQSDYSSLVRPASDHTHSRPMSEHAQSPLVTAPGLATRFKRREARMEDMSQLTMDSDTSITVSPPTPGQFCVFPVGQLYHDRCRN